jgi:magnesium chelatase subunit D
MMVEVAAPREPLERSAVVRSRLSFEADPAAFRSVWHTSQDDSRRALERAMAALSHIEIADSLVDVISEICCRLEIVSLRADIVMTKVVRALAALEGRKQPNSEDVKLAALLVLAHRKRVNPLDKTGLDEELLDKTLRDSNWDKPKGAPESAQAQSQLQSESESESEFQSQSQSQSDPEPEPPGDDQEAESDSQSLPPLLFSASAAYQFKAGLKLDGARSRLSGLRGRLKGGNRGRYVRAVQDNMPASLAVDATIRHAVLHSGREFRVGSENLHAKVRVEQKATLVILLVDASGSMAARRRMEAVKGAALSLLEDAYRKRDQVCVIAFRGAQAEVLLAPTRSMQIANQALQVLPTGGRTPLAHGLALALKIACESRLKAHLEPLLVVLSDGKGNVSLPEHDNAQASALALAAQIAERRVAALVVDTEDGYIKVGLARPLAAAMGAEYLGLEKLSADKLTLAIKANRRGPSNG